MKILIVCSNLCFGGAERVAANLANGFNCYGYKVIVVTNLFEKVNYSLQKGILLESLVSTNKNKLRKWGSSLYLLRKQIKKHQPDIIIGIMPTCSLIAKIATIGLHIPIIATEHNSFERPENAPLNKAEKFSKFYLNKLYKNITVLTEADKTVIGTRLKNVTVMPNPLFLTPINEIPSKKPIVLAAGRVDAWHSKGFDVLIKSWKKYQELNDNVTDDNKLREWWLKIAGNGKQESFEYLMNLLPDGEWVYNFNDNHLNTKHTKEKKTSAEKQNSQKSGVWRSDKYHIEFLGFQKDMESLYKKSEIFVLSSRYEGFGLVLIEAMSQGCAPVVCDYKGRQREILCPEGVSSFMSQDSSMEICENGILCEPENAEILASALKKMIEDKTYRHHAQINAVERSNYYDMEQTMNRWEIYINNIVKEK